MLLIQTVRTPSVQISISSILSRRKDPWTKRVILLGQEQNQTAYVSDSSLKRRRADCFRLSIVLTKQSLHAFVFVSTKVGTKRELSPCSTATAGLAFFVPTLLADIVPIPPSHNICQSLSRGLLMGTYLNSRNEPRIRSKPRYCKPGQSPNLTLRSLRTQLFATRVCR
jgi:hypothetical protein